MNAPAVKESVEKRSVYRKHTLFFIVFFLVSSVLTALIIIPAFNALIASEHSKSVKEKLQLETKFFTNYIDGKKSILIDFAKFPSITNAAMLSDASDPKLNDLIDNVVIGGKKGRVVLQAITGAVIIRSSEHLHGSYKEDSDWIHQLVAGSKPYHFQLLSQDNDDFTYQLSVPILYNDFIEGVFSAEFSVPLTDIFVAQSYEHVAFKLVQGAMTINSERQHIELAREESLYLTDPNLTFYHITDDAIIREKQHSLRNTILLVLFAGLAISFLMFVLLEYLGLIGNSKHSERIEFSRAYIIPMVIAVIGIAASLTAFYMIRNFQVATIEKELLTNSQSHVLNIREKLVANLDTLRSTTALFNASQSVDRQAFKSFSSHIITSRPNIKALNWVPRVEQENRADFENQSSIGRTQPFSIVESNSNGDMVDAKDRNHYFPIQYAEPYVGNEGTLGFDIASTSNRLAALTSAGSSGRSVASLSSFTAEPDESVTELTVFSPVYDHTEVQTQPVTEKNPLAKGFVMLVLRTGDIFKLASDKDNSVVSVQVQDVTHVDDARIIWGEKPAAELFTYKETIDVAGRSWSINIGMKAPPSSLWWLSWYLLFGGILFTVLTTVWIVNLIQRRHAVEALAKKLQTLHLIIANSNDIFMTVETTELSESVRLGKISYVNNAFTRLLGYSSEEALGRSPEIFFGDGTNPQQLNNVFEAMLQDQSFTNEFELYTKNKQCLLADINLSVIDNETGSGIHYAAVIRDISERKNAEADRESLIGELTDSNEELERFAFVCSHDLQEPLRMIRSFSEKLEQNISDDLANNEKGKKYLNFITDGAERAQSLVTDILTYASLNSATQTPELIRSNELIDSIKKTMATTLEYSGGTITHDPLPDLHGNKTQLYQIFQNLINNAIKYQKPGATPYVHISVSEKGPFWQFAVQDNGIGMEDRHLHKIFDVFQRLHGRRKYAGTGVGLSICKKVVERHGGKLWVESEPGVGSTFFFKLLKPSSNENYHEQERKAS